MPNAEARASQALMSFSPYSLFRIAGLVICIVSGTATLVALWFTGLGVDPSALFTSRALVALFGALDAKTLRLAFDLWLLICALGVGVFAWIFLWVTTPFHRPPRLAAAALAAQTILGLLVNDDFLILTSVELPFVFSLLIAAIWVIAQELIFLCISTFVILSFASEMTVESANGNAHYSSLGVVSIRVFAALTAAMWHGFAFCGGYLATSEERARARLASANAELRATRQLLAESVRAAERSRIARDLHDSMGHHLMALGLHLEIAARTVAESGREVIAVVQDLVRRLTAEVREAVSIETAGRPIDLKRALQDLCAGIPAPPVTLCYGADVCVSDVGLANLLLRGVQEGVSNAVRHANARNICVHIAKDGQDAVIVAVQDDGNGGSGLKRGNGLNGMHERVAEIGGRLDIVSSPGEGMALRIWVPISGAEM
jgi:two-component system sensor histidine kinase DesK